MYAHPCPVTVGSIPNVVPHTKGGEPDEALRLEKICDLVIIRIGAANSLAFHDENAHADGRPVHTAQHQSLRSLHIQREEVDVGHAEQAKPIAKRPTGN
eukprot:CAMPEP_0181206488 /NCGR_PEP_ID=MMETSP1096-20121128/21061_1 /TAXON_ID=156174 ORGANISM="Chrysochromulina ericina, Strain CCMP281" /NCGR_SAMPLE_ID=MMETSP1096 /ASSEMBLY_ACC=CAM_ASM_000453 /LENGTH=98 /DNA_ID=CAMNT_0023297389 /DNA_START=484 /DNA_END=780 /DNA_ORIENTATION=+